MVAEFSSVSLSRCRPAGGKYDMTAAVSGSCMTIYSAKLKESEQKMERENSNYLGSFCQLPRTTLLGNGEKEGRGSGAERERG